MKRLKAVIFLARTHIELEKTEATDNLLLGPADRLVNEPHFYGDNAFFATVESERGGALLAAALRTPPHSLIVHSALQTPEPVMAALAEEIHHRGMQLPGVSGPAEAVDIFARAWTAKAGCTAHLSMRERVYEL